MFPVLLKEESSLLMSWPDYKITQEWTAGNRNVNYRQTVLLITHQGCCCQNNVTIRTAWWQAPGW